MSDLESAPVTYCWTTLPKLDYPMMRMSAEHVPAIHFRSICHRGKSQSNIPHYTLLFGQTCINKSFLSSSLLTSEYGTASVSSRLESDPEGCLCMVSGSIWTWCFPQSRHERVETVVGFLSCWHDSRTSVWLLLVRRYPRQIEWVSKIRSFGSKLHHVIYSPSRRSPDARTCRIKLPYQSSHPLHCSGQPQVHVRPAFPQVSSDMPLGTESTLALRETAIRCNEDAWAFAFPVDRWSRKSCSCSLRTLGVPCWRRLCHRTGTYSLSVASTPRKLSETGLHSFLLLIDS